MVVDRPTGATPASARTTTPRRRCPAGACATCSATCWGSRSMLRGTPVPSHDGPWPEYVHNPIGEINEAFVEANRVAPGLECSTTSATVAARVPGGAARARRRAWEKVGWSPEGERPYHRFQETRVLDSWIHLQDIRDALLRAREDDQVGRGDRGQPLRVGAALRRGKEGEGARRRRRCDFNLTGRAGDARGRRRASTVAPKRSRHSTVTPTLEMTTTVGALLAARRGSHRAPTAFLARRPTCDGDHGLAQRLRRGPAHHDLGDRGTQPVGWLLLCAPPPPHSTTTSHDSRSRSTTRRWTPPSTTPRPPWPGRSASRASARARCPSSVLVAHLGGPEALRAEAIREPLPDFYAHAVADTLIDPIGQPDINITGGEEDGALTFDAEVEVRPEVDLGRLPRPARDDPVAHRHRRGGRRPDRPIPRDRRRPARRRSSHRQPATW